MDGWRAKEGISNKDPIKTTIKTGGIEYGIETNTERLSQARRRTFTPSDTSKMESSAKMKTRVGTMPPKQGWRNQDLWAAKLAAAQVAAKWTPLGSEERRAFQFASNVPQAE